LVLEFAQLLLKASATGTIGYAFPAHAADLEIAQLTGKPKKNTRATPDDVKFGEETTGARTGMECAQKSARTLLPTPNV